tara:strand:+ start:7861 stop:8619 length:759 start_codon:yes stop_codon:yes gene_type:complete
MKKNVDLLQAEWTPEKLTKINNELEPLDPSEILEWAIATFGKDITLACSFGGVSGMALLDMTMKIDKQVPVFYVDTDFLFPETYALRDKAAKYYDFEPTGFKTSITPEDQAREHGYALWTRDPDLCCEIRKVEPNGRALADKTAWIAGLRRDQGDTRKDVNIVEWDEKFDMIKINPLATWSEAQVWGYILKNSVAYNPLHDVGYPSIGCTNCTRAVKPGEDPRAGRWSDFEDKEECGIHVSPTGEIIRTNAP